jgi:PPOX class probable F420-dependent enzyme
VTAVLPTSHDDLLERPLPAVLTTHMPDGRLQSTVVWYDRDGDALLVNTMREFQKARNLRTRPRATLLIAEPGGGRWVEIRARVEVDPRDALAHLDALALRYTGCAPYFGAVVDGSLQEREHPILFRLTPVTVCTETPVAAASGQRAEAGPTVPATRTCRDEPPIPASHRDLLGAPVIVALSTLLPNGHAQTQPVWCTVDGNDVLVNTTRERRKGRNLAADPRATVLALDPRDSGRWIGIRGDVDLVEHEALEHLDDLARRYTVHEHFYGGVYPVERRDQETRVIARIHPRRITCDAIH